MLPIRWWLAQWAGYWSERRFSIGWSGLLFLSGFLLYMPAVISPFGFWLHRDCMVSYLPTAGSLCGNIGKSAWYRIIVLWVIMNKVWVMRLVFSLVLGWFCRFSCVLALCALQANLTAYWRCGIWFPVIAWRLFLHCLVINVTLDTFREESAKLNSGSSPLFAFP